MLSAIAHKWKELQDIIILGCNFCLLFSAYSTLQSYQTNVNGKSGFYSLAVLYIVYGVSALVAPAFVRAYPLKPVLIISAATYVLFIGISAWGNLIPLIIAAVIIGIGAALLWTAQAYAAPPRKISVATLALVWMASSILGFVLATIFLAVYNKPRIMFIFLTVIGGLGTATMLFLREPQGTRDPISLQFLLETVGLFKQLPMILIGGLIVYLGARGGLLWGALPSRFPAKLIGYTNICFGVAEVIGGLSFGKLSDRIGRKPVLFVGYVLESGAIALSGFATEDRVWACYVTFILFGFSDSILNVVLNAVLPILQPKKTQAAFGYKNCLQSAASSAMLFAGPYIPFEIMQLILVALLVLGVLFFFLLDRFVARVDPRAHKAAEKRKDVEAGPKSVSMQNLTNGNGSDSGTPVPSPAPTPPLEGPVSSGAVSPDAALS